MLPPRCQPVIRINAGLLLIRSLGTHFSRISIKIKQVHSWQFVCKFRLPNVDHFVSGSHGVNTLRPRKNRRHWADNIFECIFLNENVWNPIKISLKFVPKGSINNIPALVQIMAWRRPGDKPLSEPLMVSLRTHICVTRPQWVKVICLPLLFVVTSQTVAHMLEI